MACGHRLYHQQRWYKVKKVVQWSTPNPNCPTISMGLATDCRNDVIPDNQEREPQPVPQNGLLGGAQPRLESLELEQRHESRRPLPSTASRPGPWATLTSDLLYPARVYWGLMTLFILRISSFDGVNHLIIVFERAANSKRCWGSYRIVSERHIRIIDNVVGNTATAVFIFEIEHAIDIIPAP